MRKLNILKPAALFAVAICAVQPAAAQKIAVTPVVTYNAQVSQVTDPQSQCLTLQTAMTVSARRDPSVLLAQAEQASADADLAQARSLFRPQISSFARTGAGDVGLVDSVLQNQIGLRASQRVFDFGDARFAREAARFGQDASRLETDQVKAEAALETGLVGLNALEAQAQIAISFERAAYFERQLASIDTLLADGGATRTERANIASRLAEAKSIIVELQLQQEQALQRVEIDTGLKPELCEKEVQATYLRSALGVFPDLEAAIQSASLNNPASKALANRVRSETALVRRQRAQRFPVIEVVAISAFSSVGPLQDLTQQNRLGLDVSLPLYSGGAQSAQISRARAEEAAATARVAENERDLRLDITAAYARITSLGELLERRGEVVAQSQIRFEAANTQFEFRAITLPELIEARIEYENAQREAVMTEFDLLRQYLDLLALTAQLDVGPS